MSESHHKHKKDSKHKHHSEEMVDISNEKIDKVLKKQKKASNALGDLKLFIKEICNGYQSKIIDEYDEEEEEEEAYKKEEEEEEEKEDETEEFIPGEEDPLLVAFNVYKDFNLPNYLIYGYTFEESLNIINEEWEKLNEKEKRRYLGALRIKPDILTRF